MGCQENMLHLLGHDVHVLHIFFLSTYFQYLPLDVFHDRLFDNVAFGTLPNRSPIKRFVPLGVAVLSMPILGPVYDMFADRFVGSIISRHSMCFSKTFSSV